MTCQHQPQCPTAEAVDHDAARRMFHDHYAGYSVLCNAVIVFEDGGEIGPDGKTTDAHRGPAPHSLAAAA